MAKKIRNSNDIEATPSYVWPDITSRDMLAEMTDDALAARLGALHDGCNTTRGNAGIDNPATKAWEQEVCYAQQELGVRIARRQAHEKFIRKSQDQTTNQVV